ncbi:hypothetical protein IV203_017081 [Nitzschia inconspicua]|uniref:Uncharacterized protein n=1 Tax=Nitzschia inconspicua TaxID=303405 RepID=A0A9K3KRU4_9STRA|nr:hypothetical protein IV203_017081 [Nitzschia inconspicua]
MEGTAIGGFDEPRLVLYSPSTDDVGVPQSSAAVTSSAVARRRQSQNQEMVPMDPPASAPPAALSPLFGSSYIPTDIFVPNCSKSSHCSVVSEITQPVELSTPKPPRRGLLQSSDEVRPSRDIVEMRRRLAAIKERRARIKGRQHESIPHFITPGKIIGQLPPDENPRNHSETPDLSTNSKSEPVDGSAETSFDTPCTQETDDFVDAQDWSAAEPATVPVTPPRSDKQTLPLHSVSISPKSAGLSTCRTLDETVMTSDELCSIPPPETHIISNNSWNLRRLICTSGKTFSSNRVETGFDQIRATQSMDMLVECRMQQHVSGRDALGRMQRRNSRQSAGVPRAASFVQGTTLRREQDGLMDTVSHDQFLIGREALQNCTSYPHPTIPGRAYSEILSENSRFGLDLEESTAPRSLSSCLRKDPWYMTRRMKLERHAESEDLEGSHTMHTVVFVKQKNRKKPS